MKKVVLSLAILSLFAGDAFSKTQALVRKDGRRHVGLITKTKDPDGYNVRMQVGVVFVPADEVVRIEDAATPLEKFRADLARIKPTNVKARFKLAQAASRNGLLTESKEVLNGILKVDPNHARAKLLLKQIEAKRIRTEDPAKLRQEYIARRAMIAADDAKGLLRLGKWAYDKKLTTQAVSALKQATKADPKLAEAAALLAKITSDGGGEGVDGDKLLLSNADVAKVRLEEFGRKGDVVRVRYRNRVLQRFVAAMSGEDEFASDKDFGRKFMGYNSVRKLQYMLHPDRTIPPATLAALKKDIQVLTDPASMKTFRSRIWPVVRQNCATSACHGAPKGVGGFKLFNSTSRDDRITYTNFVILAGASGKRGGRMLDRDTSEESMLLDYLLLSRLAKRPHPATKKPVRPLFKDRDQTMYKVILKWISSLSAPGYPDYQLDYKPPFGMKLDLSGGGGALPPRDKSSKGADGVK